MVEVEAWQYIPLCSKDGGQWTSQWARQCKPLSSAWILLCNNFQMWNICYLWLLCSFVTKVASPSCLGNINCSLYHYFSLLSLAQWSVLLTLLVLLIKNGLWWPSLRAWLYVWSCPSFSTLITTRLSCHCCWACCHPCQQQPSMICQAFHGLPWPSITFFKGGYDCMYGCAWHSV